MRLITATSFCAVLILHVTPPALVAQWSYESSVDRMTDANRSTAFATDSQSSATLFVRCDGADDFEIGVLFPDYLASDGARVRWRFDQYHPSPVVEVNESTEGTAVFIPNGSKWAFINHLSASERVLVEVRDFRDTRHFGEFSAAGAGEAIEKIGSCVQPNGMYEILLNAGEEENTSFIVRCVPSAEKSQLRLTSSIHLRFASPPRNESDRTMWALDAVSAKAVVNSATGDLSLELPILINGDDTRWILDRLFASDTLIVRQVSGLLAEAWEGGMVARQLILSDLDRGGMKPTIDECIEY